MTTAETPAQDVAWYALSAQDTAARMGVAAGEGLAAAEVERRLAEYGPNELPTEPPPGTWAVARGQLTNPMNIMLLIVGAASLAIGQVPTALVVLALVASFQAFGTLLAVGPMLLPAAAARCWGLGVAASMALATGFGLAASVAGLLISYHANLPSGPAIVLAAGLLFGLSLLATGALRRLAPPIGGDA